MTLDDERGREFDERPWGSFTVLDDELSDHKVKRMVVAPGKRLSYQRHAKRAEHWFVVKGTATVTLDGVEFQVPPGASVDIGIGVAHRCENRGTTPVVFIEVQTDDLLAEGRTRSFEFFPPKSDDESVVLERTLSALSPLDPSFVSVTYRGGRESRQRTYDLVTQIQSAGRIAAMAHLICVGHRRDEMRDLLKNYLDSGVVNVMALGGDLPEDGMAASEFSYALELVELVREVGDFCVGVGAHPHGHPRSVDRVSDAVLFRGPRVGGSG